jgi:hypothetical protein
MNYLQLKRKQFKLRKELRLIEQELCELDCGHNFTSKEVEWSGLYEVCSKCKKRNLIIPSKLTK